MMQKDQRKPIFNIWYFVTVFLAVLLLQQWWSGSAVETVPYSQFRTLLREGKVAAVDVGSDRIRAELREPTPEGHSVIETVPVDRELAEDLALYDVEFTGTRDEGTLETMFLWILPIIIFFGIGLFLLRRLGATQSGLMSIGKSNARVTIEEAIDVTFDDVAGVDEAKEELAEIVGFLADPSAYGRLGARLPKGVLLVGPPGTGKTLLARAVAGEAGVTFFHLNGSEFVELFVGVGASRVRDLFDQARKSAPCIIFIDELDALGRARGVSALSGASDEKEQTLNQLLAELDGFDPSNGVVLLAATNRPEILDPALLRSGRFDRQILVDRPDKLARVQILEVHARNVALADDVDLEQIAGLTVGFSGADLATLVNEGAILATRREGEAVTTDDFTRAIERIVAGLEKKSRLLSSEERERVAYHETGHALVTLALPGTDAVHKVSIIPRGISALGYNLQRPTEDRFLLTQEELENRMAGLLAGRAAELLVFGDISTGAANDLDRATEIARGMVMRYGMNEELGPTVYAREPTRFLSGTEGRLVTEQNYSEQTAAQIDEAVRTLLNEAADRASAILSHNRPLLDETATRLLEKETLTADELPTVVVWQEGDS